MFFKVDRRVRLPVPSPSFPCVFGPILRLHTAETQNSPPAFFFLYFIYGLLLRKSDHLPLPLFRCRLTKSLGCGSRDVFFSEFGIVHFTQVL